MSETEQSGVEDKDLLDCTTEQVVLVVAKQTGVCDANQGGGSHQGYPIGGPPKEPGQGVGTEGIGPPDPAGQLSILHEGPAPWPGCIGGQSPGQELVQGEEEGGALRSPI